MEATVQPTTAAILDSILGQYDHDQPLTDADRLQLFRTLVEKVQLPTYVHLLPLLLNLDGHPYTLNDHFPMEMAFTTRLPPSLLLKAGRQIAKCGVFDDDVLRLADGRQISVHDLRVGDQLLAMNANLTFSASRVLNVWASGPKQVYRLRTRLGSELLVTADHRLRTFNGYQTAGSLTIGTRLAAVRSGGTWGTYTIRRDRIILTAYLIGDGCCGLSRQWTLTNMCPEVVAEFIELAGALEQQGPVGYPKKGTDALTIKLHRDNQLLAWLKEDELYTCYAWDKFIPDWVFLLSREDTILFLSRLWATDGSIKPRKSALDISYSTTSRKLARGVRSLLNKLGIQASIRRSRAGYRKNGQYIRCHDSYLVRVETREGWQTFLDTITVPGKPRLALPITRSNNNRDTVPAEVNTWIAELARDTRCKHTDSLNAVGLRHKPKYPLSRSKLESYIRYFSRVNPAHPRLQDLRNLLSGGVTWDEIVSIENIGIRNTHDIEMEGTHNFVLDGVVSHNSTTMAARIILLSNAIPHFSILVVTPLYEQVRRFSTNYVRKFLEQSPVKSLWMGTGTENSVLQRSFRNFSKLYFSFALLDADRIRGISAHMICYDREAEILTRTGWKPVACVTTEDEIADVNDSGVVEWNRPTGIVRRLYTGEMVTFRHRGMRLRVTGDHKMWVNFKVKPTSTGPDVYRFVEADTLARTETMGFKMTCGAAWGGDSPGSFVFDGIASSLKYRDSVQLAAADTAELVGWYLAEGHTNSRGQIVLTQSDGRYANEIVSCLLRCGLNFTKSHPGGGRAPQYTIHCRQLGAYLQPLGKARDKYIPAEFFDSPELLKPLLRALYLGDACYHRQESWDSGTLRTRSRRLADDVHRAWLMLGRPAVIHVRMMRPNPESEPEPLYEVCAYKRDYQIFWRADFIRKHRVTVEQVQSEEVYCFTTKNHRPIVRGGWGQIPVISSQCYDEVQDMDHTLLPIIKETMSHSKWRLQMYTGTPKTMDNTIQRLWSRSSQAEWIIPCKACGKENIPQAGLDLEKMIGPYREDICEEKPAVICARCGRPIFPRDGRWWHRDVKKKLINPGYHIPQVIMPIHYADKQRWAELLGKQSGAGNTTVGQFYNEVLGESYDVGTKLITETELTAASLVQGLHTTTTLINRPREPQEAVALKDRYVLRVLGVDWGGGGEDEVSFTTAAVLGYRGDGKIDVIYGRRLLNPQDHLQEAQDLLHIYNMFDCHLFAHDYNGAGSIRETLMVQAGLDYDRVVPMVYVATASKNMMSFHKSDDNHSRNFWLLDKARALLLVCNALKLKWIRTFQYDFFDEDNPGLLHDFLALQENKIEMARGRDVYTIVRNPAFTDDFAHSVTFAACAMWHRTGQWPNLASLAGLQLSIEQASQANPQTPWDEYNDRDY